MPFAFLRRDNPRSSGRDGGACPPPSSSCLPVPLSARRLPCIVFVLSLIATLGTTAIGYYWQEAAQALRRNRLESRTVYDAMHELDRIEFVLESLRGLFRASREVEPNEWEDFLSALEVPAKAPLISVVGFAEIKKKGDTGILEVVYRDALDTWGRNCADTCLAAMRDFVAEATSPPIVPALREFSRIARKGKEARMKEEGFVLFLEAPPANRKNTGLVFACFSRARFVSLLRRDLGTDWLDVSLGNGSASGSEVTVRTVERWGRPWSIVFYVTERAAPQKWLLPGGLFLLGLLLSFVLCRLIGRIEQGRWEAEVLVRELDAANRRWKELDGRRREFLTAVAHEIRTPAATIAGSVDLLLRDLSVDDPRLSRALVGTKNSAERLESLIDRFLDFTVLETGRLEMKMEEISLRAVAEEALEDARAVLQKNSVEASVREEGSREGGESFLVRGDRIWLRQAIRNLLENAARYAKRRVEIVLRRGNGRVECRVIDDGPGIPEDLLPRIFERYTTGARGAGLGLGLAIAASVVKAHGATIEASNLPSGGACFTLRF
ncbi:MAG: sensor histidine kinase [Candidatus Hydrogenedentota bacterium]|nr:MAG: sensor histidine kinase [Candidatus Hydrogenedentota bacterium]